MRGVFWAVAICLAAGCSKQGEGTAGAAPLSTPAPAKKLLVMATTAPMYCFTKNVAGELADVRMIVPPGVPEYAFHWSPEEIRAVSQANIVIENGLGYEQWMDRLEAEGLIPHVERVIAARGTGPGIPGLPGDPDTVPGDAPADPMAPANPYVWLDPLMAIKEVQNIRDALMARDPANADQYLSNENHYEGTLRDLDDEIGRLTVDIPNRRLLCLGNYFDYFLSRYEFPVVADYNSPQGGSWPGAWAGGFSLKEAMENVTRSAAERRADGVLAPAEVNAADLNQKGVRIVIADPMDSGPASADLYERVARANAEALREGLMK